MTTFNIVLEGKVLFIDPKYDCPLGRVEYERKYYRIKEYNKFYGSNYKNWRDLIERSVIIHYCGAEKPWRYSFGLCNKEWKEYYDCSPYEGEELTRKSFMDYMKEKIKQQGLRGIYYYIKDAVLERTGPIGKKRLEKVPGDFV